MIVFVDQSGQLGGAELCLADIAAHYRGRGRVVLLSPGPFEEELLRRDVDVSVIHAGTLLSSVTKRPSLLALLKGALALPRFVATLKTELTDAKLLYLNTPKALLLGVAARGRLPVPIIYHLHDLLERAHFSRTNIRLLIAAANRCRCVIANSQATADAFRGSGGRVPVHVIPNGFDCRPFDAVSTSRIQALRSEFGGSEGPVAAVFGRIARWKGQLTLLKAARLIPGLVVWVVGEALYTTDDEAYKRELQELAALPDLKQRVYFTGMRDDVPALMKAADIVVHTSIGSEPFGRVIVEGLLAGRPVVASNGGGPSEILSPGRTGWLVSPGDVNQLANTLREILAAPDRARETAATGNYVARLDYGLPRILQLTDAVLLPLLS